MTVLNIIFIFLIDLQFSSLLVSKYTSICIKSVNTHDYWKYQLWYLSLYFVTFFIFTIFSDCYDDGYHRTYSFALLRRYHVQRLDSRLHWHSGPNRRWRRAVLPLAFVSSPPPLHSLWEPSVWLCSLGSSLFLAGTKAFHLTVKPFILYLSLRLGCLSD